MPFFQSSTVARSGNFTTLTSSSETLTANIATATLSIFRVTGSVKVLRLFGVVTTTLVGQNHTGAWFRFYDQTLNRALTLEAGAPALSNFGVGSTIERTALAATIATVKQSSNAQITESAAAGDLVNCEFDLVAKNGANSDIQYTYSTTDAPTSGVIQFFCEWRATSADGAVAAV